MCGIVGELSFSRPSEADWPLIIQKMIRRGPDDVGLWRDDQHCVLGFRCLSILDLSPAGHQPMFTHDGRYVLVMNGEIYNFRELRQELEQSGVRFKSTGDSEVVLYALASWAFRR